MAKQITIEEINGKKYTVVWHANMSENYMRSELTWLPLKNGCLINYPWGAATHIATALPALPRNPKPEAVPLIHLYAAHGLIVCGEVGKHNHVVQSGLCFIGTVYDSYMHKEITHATHNGERVEIAITDEAHNG